ncbi:hypothetical protein AB6A40_009322 [Gnathostoma spinigerum]|uniref:Uncharacterized protein n=1 Tax=Gnathostoma spinigerum TaxID=75299 RepID=A0ABD6ERP2_9BILA
MNQRYEEEIHKCARKKKEVKMWFERNVHQNYEMESSSRNVRKCGATTIRRTALNFSEVHSPDTSPLFLFKICFDDKEIRTDNDRHSSEQQMTRDVLCDIEQYHGISKGIPKRSGGVGVLSSGFSTTLSVLPILYD